MIGQTRLVQVRQNVLKHNDVVARALRKRFEDAGVLVVSIVLAIVLLVVLVKFLRTVVRGLREFFAGRPLPRSG